MSSSWLGSILMIDCAIIVLGSVASYLGIADVVVACVILVILFPIMVAVLEYLSDPGRRRREDSRA